MPKYPTADPNYRILSRQRARYTHYYFIRDPVPGPIALCVGAFLPFSITYYLNGHHFIEQQLRSVGIEFRKNDNAFLWVVDAPALQAAADALSAELIRARLDHWTLIVGPNFSKSRPPLLTATGRVLPQSHIPAQLPHPQAVRAFLRPRAAAPKR